jgi:hypothetical protein
VPPERAGGWPRPILARHIESYVLLCGYAHRRPGYPALADFMGQHGGMAMYKQFANLSTHSLLMQQVQLLNLQRELEL